ncbi:uncharacterized protein METZ01_LOCUS20179 [marine metagenome]|uniref:Uncharacterized protein n=1 Tax=marine metagenome TaxID=408172 RepID=A0A381PJX4_9ZZZZ
MSPPDRLEALENIFAFWTHGKPLRVPIGDPFFSAQSPHRRAGNGRSSHISFVDIVSEAFVVAIIELIVYSSVNDGVLVHLDLSLILGSG